MQQYGAKVHYKDLLVGEYFVDLLINDPRIRGGGLWSS